MWVHKAALADFYKTHKRILQWRWYNSNSKIRSARSTHIANERRGDAAETQFFGDTDKPNSTQPDNKNGEAKLWCRWFRCVAVCTTHIKTCWAARSDSKRKCSHTSIWFCRPTLPEQNQKHCSENTNNNKISRTQTQR